ncbi:hypothetical protein PIB30_087822 [Stylosanthes scabra]|uniref:Uncharacterized protein n=1 Tax=Stylosanthes scabra TaxID=79078 RepID=A0ABU6SUM4_9FABA|nr:hypothetical protein [Stylosanthes scabra]
MEDLSMFQRPRTVALEYEKPGTYGMVSIYPLYRLVECGSADSGEGRVADDDQAEASSASQLALGTADRATFKCGES